jgi:hypothetical protein
LPYNRLSAKPSKRALFGIAATAAVNGTLKSKLFFEKYQIFSPAIYMGTFASLILVAILYVAVAWMASIQSPTRFQKPPKIKKQ